MKYIQWITHDETGATRISKWHLPSNDPKSEHALCGRLIGWPVHGTLFKKPVCKRCMQLASDQRRETAITFGKRHESPAP